jgi:hypothetical protein
MRFFASFLFVTCSFPALSPLRPLIRRSARPASGRSKSQSAMPGAGQLYRNVSTRKPTI